jgi:isopentenyl phosphate kinase
MSEQDQERQQADEPQEDMELPDEQSEDVKGGMAKKAPGEDQMKEKW